MLPQREKRKDNAEVRKRLQDKEKPLHLLRLERANITLIINT